MKIIKDKNGKKVFYALLAFILIVVIVFFTFKFVQKYNVSNQFDFDSVSPQGYFQNLQTSIPESPTA